MKTIISTTLTLFAILLVSQSCIKDRGNKTERDIPLLEIKLWDGSDISLEVKAGDSLRVTPVITSTFGEFDERRHRFEWMAIVDAGPSGVTRPMYIPVGFSRNLDFRVNLDANRSYVIRYRVFDLETGVFAQASFRIFVAERFSRGWLIMNEVGNPGDQIRMRLDMLELEGDKFSYIEDVLAAAGSELPLTSRGKPIGMVRFIDNLGQSPNNVAYYLLSQGPTGSQRINLATFRQIIGTDTTMVGPFAWRERWSIVNHFVASSFTHPDFYAVNMKNASSSTLIAGRDVDGRMNLYHMNTAVNMFWALPSNTLTSGGVRFEPSTKFAGDGMTGSGWIVFDQTARDFYRIGWTSSHATRINESGGIGNAEFYRRNKLDYELVEILYNTNTPIGVTKFIYAIMRKVSTNEYWVLRARHGDMSQERWQRVDANTRQLMGQAAAQERPVFEVGGPHSTNIYYAVGDKVYSYSVTENISRQVLDGEGREITFLRFTGLTTVQDVTNFTEDILVGLFDPRTQRGQLEQYFVPQREPFEDGKGNVNQPRENRAWGQHTNHGQPFVRFGRIIDVRSK